MSDKYKNWPTNPRGVMNRYDWHKVACEMRAAVPDAPLKHVVTIVSASLDIEQPVLFELYEAVDAGDIPWLSEFKRS